MTAVAEFIISKTQIIFLLGRNILEGVTILHETLYEMRRKKMKGVIMKLHFEKAYDKVSWLFLNGSIGEEKLSFEMERVGGTSWD
jgi:hypothetical protein